MKMQLGVLFVSSLTIVACGAKSASQSQTTAGTAKMEVPNVNPAIAALLKPVLECKYEDGRFKDCTAADDFRKSKDDAFNGEKGDADLLKLMSHPDVRVRSVASDRGLDEPEKVLAKKENAEAFVAQLERETDNDVRGNMANDVGYIDAEKQGFTARIKGLAANKAPEARESLARHMLSGKATPLGYEIVGALMNDAERSVRRAAVMGLHNSTVFSNTPACKIFSDALDGPNANDVAWSAASLGHCPGLQPKVLSFLEGKTAKPSTVTNAVGIEYSLAVQSLCNDPKSRGIKNATFPTPDSLKRAYTVASRLASKEVPDPNTRRSAQSALVQCDAARAKGELAKLSKDGDKFVSDGAKAKLSELAKKKS